MRLRATISILLLATAGVVHAEDMNSASYSIRGSHVNAGANALLQPPSSSSGTLGRVGASVGSGVSHDDSMGPSLSLAAGYWMVESAIAAARAANGDVDADGIPDSIDNCIEQPNPSQFDADLDGYGNACDFDVDNDGAASLVDLHMVRDAARFPDGADLVFDFDEDGGVGLSDLSLMMDASRAVLVPGPSGLSCAGDPLATPCVAP